MSEPRWQHGKICYLILASKNAEESAKFYTDVFGWSTRSHDNGDLAFDDTTGMVSGMWDTSLEPRAGGYEIDIWVEDVLATSQRIVDAGGSLSGNLVAISDHEQYQRFIDPDGNYLGLYHHDS